MSRLGDVEIKVWLRDLDITDFVESATTEGHVEKPNRSFALSLMNTADGRSKAIKVNTGDAVKFYVDGVREFVGIVFDASIDESGKHTLTCYDRNIYLLKSNDTRAFRNKKASDIIKSLAKDFGIPLGTIEDTGYVIPTLILREHSLFDMMNKALVLTRKQTGKRFFLTSTDGKLQLKRHVNNINPWVIEAGANLISAGYSISVEETKTQVKVTGGKANKLTHSVKSVSSQKLYGIMQHIEEMDEKATSSQVKQRAETLLKELNVINDQANIYAVGIIDVKTGSGIYVREPMTGIAGGYYVSSDIHTFTNGMHTMELEISKSLEMPNVEISDEELGKK